MRPTDDDMTESEELVFDLFDFLHARKPRPDIAVAITALDACRDLLIQRGQKLGLLKMPEPVKAQP